MSELIKQRENEKQTAEFAQNVSNKDLISRKTAIDEIEYELEMINSALDSITLDFNARERLRQRKGEAREILNSIQQLPSAQPEQDAEFWRKRAEEYRNQCIALTVNMTKGVKFDTVGFNEDGLVFKRGQPEQRWIPCSERLPEDYQDVLVWFEYYRYGSYNRMYSTYGIGTYSKLYDSWMVNHESGWKDLRVIEWCELPKPHAERRAE